MRSTGRRSRRQRPNDRAVRARPPSWIYADRQREPYLVEDAGKLISGIRRRGGDVELT